MKLTDKQLHDDLANFSRFTIEAVNENPKLLIDYPNRYDLFKLCLAAWMELKEENK
jgi:hypothetical protein